MSDTTTKPTKPGGKYPALRLLEKDCPPLRYGREPFWRAGTVLEDTALIPSWNWRSVHEFTPDTWTVTLDVNGAYLGAISSVTIAHSQLTHSGSWEQPGKASVLPGYYLITVPYWAWSGMIVSPMGDSHRLANESSVWVSAPTLILLLELADSGHLGDFEILDSWTARPTTRFTTWYSQLRAVRERLLDAIEAAHEGGVLPRECECDAHDRYSRFKQGYGAAMSMILNGGYTDHKTGEWKNCKTFRPDWAHTVYAAHAATQWRKAWRYTFTGQHIISMGNTDELRLPQAGLAEAMERPTPPFQMDDTGRKIGAFKAKHVGAYQEIAPVRPLRSLSAHDETEDLV